MPQPSQPLEYINVLHDGYTFIIKIESLVFNDKVYGHYVDNNGVYREIKRKSLYGQQVRKSLVKLYTDLLDTFPNLELNI